MHRPTSAVDFTRSTSAIYRYIGGVEVFMCVRVLSCRAGCALVTDNDRDFSRIRRFISFEYVKPWRVETPRCYCAVGVTDCGLAI